MCASTTATVPVESTALITEAQRAEVTPFLPAEADAVVIWCHINKTELVLLVDVGCFTFYLYYCMLLF